MSAATLLQTSIPDLKLIRRGKVRDVYAVDDDHLLIVATDRISASTAFYRPQFNAKAKCSLRCRSFGSKS